MNKHETSKIGVATATIIGMNAMIGSGIFTAPATMAANVGPAGIIAYLIVVVSVWFMALSLARLAALYPQEGSFYVYASQWGGHRVGMIASSCYFIGLLIAMGLLAQMAGQYLTTFFPAVSAFNLGLYTLGALVVLNLFGVVLSQIGQHILIVCTVFPLIATTILCLTKANLANLTPFAPFGFANVFKATRVVIFGFLGFESATSLFNIVRDPARNVPRALTYSIVLVGIIYTLFVGAMILATPLDLFQSARVPLSETLHVLFPQYPWLISIIHFAILSAIIGTIHSMIWGSSNLLTLLIKRFKSPLGLKLANSSLAHNTRAAVLFVGACIALTYSTINNPDLFFFLTALFIILAFILSLITLLTVKEEWTSGHNIKTVIGIATASAILFFAAEGLVQQLSTLW
ncbi:hypothetical protein Noda2021_08360 [Candidatus Dependentiae bacterium Noda2021]|nr:hypothetical protein Noda2021_08360 [Candidatus Dependentiae bacterium Noda2021]